MKPQRIIGVVLLAGLIGLLGWRLAQGPDEENPADDGSTTVASNEGPTMTLSKARKLSAADLKTRAAAMDPRAVWEPVFPGRMLHTCGRPITVGEGVYRVGKDTLLVHDKRTLIVSDAAEGDEQVIAIGTTVGRVSWKDGACKWEGQRLVTITGQVEGGGVHRVAGCPIGETLTTEADGSFEVRVPDGRVCVARVVNSRDEGLAMGPKVAVDFDAPTLSLKPATEPLNKKQIGAAVFLMTMTSDKVRADAQEELDRLMGIDLDTPQIRWLREQAESRVTLMEGELARLQDPNQREVAVEELLFSTTN